MVENLQLPVLAFLSAFLALIPLPRHVRARDIPCLALTGWLLLSCLSLGVNSVLWAGNTKEHVLAWCDISSKIIFATSYALPLCVFCIVKHLEFSSSSRIGARETTFSNSEERRRRIFELTMCIVTPIILTLLHYFVQDYRFEIVEDFGCRSSTFVSPYAIILIWVIQLCLWSANTILLLLAFRNLLKSRARLQENILMTSSALTIPLFLRLFLLSSVLTLWGASISSLSLWYHIESSGGVHAWTSWTDVHANSSSILSVPRRTMSGKQWAVFMVLGMYAPVAGIVFVLTGITNVEVRKMYGAFRDGYCSFFYKKSMKSEKQTGKARFIRPLHLPVFSAASIESSRATHQSPPTPTLKAKTSSPFSLPPSLYYYHHETPHSKDSKSSSSADLSVTSSTCPSTADLHDSPSTSMPPTPQTPDFDLVSPGSHRPFCPPSEEYLENYEKKEGAIEIRVTVCRQAQIKG